MVAKHIKTLLYEHDCVIIPGFGGLITRYVPAVVNSVKHTISPPSKRVAFNEKLVLNDGLLISTIAYQNNISAEEAQQQVAAFVTGAKEQLRTDNRFELSAIGVFKYNAAHRLEFSYTGNDNMLEASFGLPEITARPMRFEEPAVLRTLRKDDKPVTGSKFKRRIRKVYTTAASLAIVGLAGSALYLFSLQTDYNLSTLNPITLFANNQAAQQSSVASDYTSDYVPVSDEERFAAYSAVLPEVATTETVTEEVWSDSAESIATAEAVEVEANEEVIVEEAVEPVTTIKERTGRYYIINGGYSRLENAETARQMVLEHEHEGKVLLPLKGSRLFRVSVADFATADEAQAAMNHFRKTYGDSIWVLNN